MTRYLAPAALILALVGAGCSAPAPSDTATPATSAPASGTPAAAVNHDGRAIEITGNDTMKFSVTEIKAKPGEKLSVTLVNLGTTPKFSMGHNWLLLTADAPMDAFLVAAAEAATNDYVPQNDHRASILAVTKLLGPNERDTVTFTAPATAGSYPFICSFPGHYQVGMRGMLIVE